MIDIRPAAEGDRDALEGALALAFNGQRWTELTLEGRLCAFDGPLLVASGASLDYEQWFAGRAVPCAGVTAVAVVPEHRGHGIATQVVGELLAAQRARGRVVSALYPANAALYRKLGYEYGGVRVEHSAPLEHLPVTKAGQVTEIGPEAVPLLMKCFSRFAAGHNGVLETADERHFTTRMMAGPNDGLHQRSVAFVAAGETEGFASYYTTPRASSGEYSLHCKLLVATSTKALAALLGYFARFENAASALSWFGPPNMGPLGMLLSSNSFSLQHEQARWMERVLDVPKALLARGYPRVTGEASVAIEDPLFPENRGPWQLEVDQGVMRVAPGGKGTTTMTVNALSALYTGQVTPADLVLAGALSERSPDLSLLTSLFAGPPPWLPTFF